jgi:hypothetical protein
LRKVMLLAAMLAMVLAAAAPALGQQIGGNQGPMGGEDAVQAGDNVQFAAVCQNILGAFEASAGQGATAGAFAAGGENAAVLSEVAQSQGVSVSQVNKCLNVTAAAQYAAATGTATATATPTATATATAAAAAQYQYAAGTASPTALPPTGGPVPNSSALALGAGALLVVGGIVARRLFR